MRPSSSQLSCAAALSLAVMGLFAISTGAPRSGGTELNIPAFAAPIASLDR